MRCSRRESCSRVLTPAFIFKAPGLFVRCCVVVDAVFKFPRTPVHPEVLKPSARIPFAKRVQMTLSRVIDKMVVDEGRALQPCRYRLFTHMSCIILYPYSTYPCRGYTHVITNTGGNNF